ncbi:MAG: hypothetical protein JRI95_17235 [Deltaproteobacteria bacterium]|nr:hypothetical protein [Deltaproteobacteria bacterium]
MILMVGPAGSGKTSALQEVSVSTSLPACGHAQAGAPLVNVNLELCRRMLDLSVRQRALQLPRLLGEIVPACRDLSARQAGMKKRFEEYLDELTKGNEPGKVSLGRIYG